MKTSFNFCSVAVLLVLGPASVTTQAAESENPIVGYVSVGGAKKIAVYEMNRKTGALTSREAVDAGGSPGSLAIGPKKRFLYAAIRSRGSVATFRIDAKTGGLKQIASTRVVTNPVYVAVAPSGKFLLTAYYGAAKVAVYPIGGDGIVRDKATFIGETGRNPHSILINSKGLVCVPNTGADQILQYRLDDKTGKLNPLKPAVVKTASGTGPRHFYFHPTKPFAYCCNEKGSSVTGFALGRDGLKAFQTMTTLPTGFRGRNSNADIEITPDGNFLYASNRGHDSLAMYRIDQKTGRLTALGQAKTEKTPREFNIDPTGRFVYSAGQGSGRMISYRIQNDGTLKPLKTYDVGRGPSWVLFFELP